MLLRRRASQQLRVVPRLRCSPATSWEIWRSMGIGIKRQLASGAAGGKAQATDKFGGEVVEEGGGRGHTTAENSAC